MARGTPKDKEPTHAERRKAYRDAGISEAEIDAALGAAEHAEHAENASDGAFEVWPENAASVELFCRCATQWNVAAGMAGLVYLGLRYEAVESVMRMRRAKDRAALFDDLQVMEDAALAVLNGNDG